MNSRDTFLKYLQYQAQLDEQGRLLAERGMVLVGNEDEETTCEDEDRANANGMSYFEINRHPYTYINNY